MKMNRWIAILAMVVSTMVWACDSGNSDAKDAVTADEGLEVAADDVLEVSELPADTLADTTQPKDNGTTDPGQDPGTADLGQVDNSPVEVIVTCPVVVTGPTCREIAACVLPCGDVDRETQCLGTTTGEEKTKWETLRDCLATAACPKVFDKEQFTECVTTNCLEALEGCVASADGKCCSIVNCRKECDEDDPSCPMNCYGRATVAEQAVFIAYKDCILDQECAQDDIRANGWPNYTCEGYAQNNFCPIQTQACFPPNGCN